MMTKSEFEKALERALSIYAFYSADEKKFSRQRTENGYHITSTNENLIKDLARITEGEITKLDKASRVFVNISDFTK